MRIARQYSHMNGREWIEVHAREQWAELEQAIADIAAEQCRTKLSQEKGNRSGKALYSPIAINERFVRNLRVVGWEEYKMSFWVSGDAQANQRTMALDAAAQKAEFDRLGLTSYYAYNQIDFLKGRIAAEVQLGKYAFVAYDLTSKLLGLYVANKIDVAVEIVPTHEMARAMSSGVSSYEKALYDIIRQGRTSPPMPFVLLGIEP